MMSNPFGLLCKGDEEDLPRQGTVQGHGVIVEDFHHPMRPRQVKLGSKTMDNESVELFLQNYKVASQMILKRLDFIEDAYKKRKDCFEYVGLNGKEVFDGLAEELKDLEQYLTGSARYMPDFNVKICQELHSIANQRYQEVRSLVMPKKKFNFSSKKKQQHPSTSKQIPSSSDEELPTLPDSPRERLLKETRINTLPTSDLSLDISNLCNRYICEEGSRVNKHDITLNKLRNCFIELRGNPGSLRVKSLYHCVILCGPVSYSIYGEDCQSTTFAIACHQFRLHYSSNCNIYLHVTSRAVIEDCRHLEIGLFNYKYDNLEQDYKDSGLDYEKNEYKNVGDFNWLTSDAPSPNWKLIDNAPNWDEERQKFKDNIAKLTNDINE